MYQKNGEFSPYDFGSNTSNQVLCIRVFGPIFEQLDNPLTKSYAIILLETLSSSFIKMADQVKQFSDTMSEHCLNVISGSACSFK